MIPNRTAVYKTDVIEYPKVPPFHPPERFPEYPFGEDLDKANKIYDGVRATIYLMGLDREHFGEPGWNPFGAVIKPGYNVLVKPNLVISDHPSGAQGIESAVAHGSVLRALLDYIYIALKGKGKITIADSPIKEVDFARIVHLLGIDVIQEFYRQETGIEFNVIDFRDLVATRDKNGIITKTENVCGDPSGYTIIDLGKASLLAEVDRHSKRYRSTATVYENVIQEYHRPGVHKYSIPNTLLRADAFINLAKLKTHRYTGVTLTLKNLIGLTNEKRWLPHYRVGRIDQGGDSLPHDRKLREQLAQMLTDRFMTSRYGKVGFHYILPLLSKVNRAMVKPLLDRGDEGGSENVGYANDTIWRSTLDLNIIAKYADKFGLLQQKQQRNALCFIDGIIGGDKNAPLNPSPKKVGLIIGGFNPVAVDVVASRLMGFDYMKIPKIVRATRMKEYEIGNLTHKEIEIVSNEGSIDQTSFDDLPSFNFEPTSGWKGHIELT